MKKATLSFIKKSVYWQLTFLLIFVSNILTANTVGANEVPVEITGELKKWHKVTLTFDGPETSESDEFNPFMNYRLNVVFAHEESGK
ncbi:MAG: DUF5060 domain-containing protein, partial [Bacteroidales bacterium]